MARSQPEGGTERDQGGATIDRRDGVTQTARSAAAAESGDPFLSVVAVTRNEADRIEACLESVFAACRAVPSYEVVLVDSNSTDDTVQRAREYPITVLQIPTDDLATPAAGRYVGRQHAAADRILFVDGDMELADGWLERALRCLEYECVAAVDGWLGEPGADRVREVDAVRGVALYDARALRAVGGFEPSLESLEDIHLGFQLSAAGYRLLRVPATAAHHPDRPPITEPFRRWRRGYAVGPGQVLRASAGSPRLLARHASRLRHRFAMGLWLGLGALALRDRSRLFAWAILSLLGVAIVVRKLGLRAGVTFCTAKTLGVAGIVRGATRPLRDRESFPVEAVDVLARGPVHDGDSDAFEQQRGPHGSGEADDG